MVQMVSPEDVVAPVLHELDGPIVITPDNKDDSVAVISWEPADFGVTTQVDYVLELSKADGSAKKTLAAGVTKTEATVAYLDLNGIVYADFELEAGIPHDLLLTVGASVGVTETYWSEPMTITVTATAAAKVYPKLFVVGSYNGWAHDANQYLFDFEGSDNSYEGMVDFGEDHAANEFKITGGAWGKDEHSMNGAHDPETKTISLVVGGGDNIYVYQAKRYYHLTFTRTPDLTVDFSFDQIGVIGDFNGWGADVVMQFNPATQKFYADVEFPADGGFKFRADAGWDVNWGSTGSGVLDSGDNIPVKAGNYRVYLNMNDKNKMTYELNAAAYGTEEDTTMGGGTTEPDPEPTPTLGWGLVGEYNGWGAESDIMLASDGTYLVAKGVSLSGQFKFRKDGGWDVNFGAPGDVEPFELTPNVETELAAGGKNFTIAEGTYDVYLDEANAKAWFINDGSYPGGGAAPEASEWGIVGVVNGWAAPDVTMYKTSTDGLFVAYNVAMPDGGFKIRANGEWNDAKNYGLETAGAVEVDHWYSVITSGGSGDMSLTAGNYDIWFDLNNTKVYIMTPGKAISEAQEGTAGSGSTGGDTEYTWYIVGNFNGWAVGDTNYQMTKEGDWYVFKNFTADGQGVKFNAGNWDVNRGGEWTSVGGEIAVTNGGSDIIVPAGTYDVYMNAAADKVYFMTVGETPAVTLTGTWYLVGNFNGWTVGDENYKLTAEGNWYVFKNFTADGQGVKLNNGTWDVNRGGTFSAADEAISVVHNGSDMMVAAGTYDVYLNAAEDTLYFMTPGSTPSN